MIFQESGGAVSEQARSGSGAVSEQARAGYA